MWYYVQENQRQGPVDEATAANLVQTGTIASDTLVWKEGMTDWMQAGETDLLMPPFKASPAPPSLIPPLQPGITPPYTPESMRTLWLWFAWLIGAGLPLCLIIIGIIPLIAGTVISYILIYRFWTIIQSGPVRTTPGKAVGFLFIPFFNLYWLYVAFVGLAQDMNQYCNERNIDGPRISEGLALTYFILALCSIIPYLGYMISIANLVIFIILMKQFTDLASHILACGKNPGTQGSEIY